jgi:hypothetical protein
MLQSQSESGVGTLANQSDEKAETKRFQQKAICNN